VYPAGYPLSRVVGSVDESQASDGWHYEKSVREHLEDYQLAKDINPVFGCDITGNTGMVPLFKSIDVNSKDIVFSGPKKWAMYQRMKYLMEKRLLHVVRNKDFDYQAKRIVVTSLKTSTYKRVGHELETDHDDTVDAITGLIHLLDNPVLIEPSLRII